MNVNESGCPKDCDCKETKRNRAVESSARFSIRVLEAIRGIERNESKCTGSSCSIGEIIEHIEKNYQHDGDLDSQVATALNQVVLQGYVQRVAKNEYRLLGPYAKVWEYPSNSDVARFERATSTPVDRSTDYGELKDSVTGSSSSNGPESVTGLAFDEESDDDREGTYRAEGIEGRQRDRSLTPARREDPDPNVSDRRGQGDPVPDSSRGVDGAGHRQRNRAGNAARGRPKGNLEGKDEARPRRAENSIRNSPDRIPKTSPVANTGTRSGEEDTVSSEADESSEREEPSRKKARSRIRRKLFTGKRKRARCGSRVRKKTPKRKPCRQRGPARKRKTARGSTGSRPRRDAPNFDSDSDASDSVVGNEERAKPCVRLGDIRKTRPCLRT